jgi:XTP/dITP diphosphohydrolase
MKLLLGTRNHGKILEMRDILGPLPHALVSLDDAGIHGEPDEVHGTLEENALLKARWYREKAKNHPTVADDSGLFVEALTGELGVQTRRWGAGADASDEEWVEFFLDRMRKENDKRASFVSTIAFIDNEGNERLFQGRCDGIITDRIESAYPKGLPLIGAFKPLGFDRVLGNLTKDELNRVNHRRIALGSLAEHLR